MRLGIVSDTHDNVAAIERVVDVFDDEGVGAVIHCGDFVAPPVLPFFSGHEVHGVLGNNDGEIDGLERGFDDLGNGSQLHGRYADLVFDGLQLGVLHGDQGLDAVDELAATGDYDVVCYGHVHRRDERVVDGTTVLNPGAHFPTVPEAHRRVVVLDTETADHRFLAV